jgi:hypothetical protein
MKLVTWVKYKIGRADKCALALWILVARQRASRLIANTFEFVLIL